VAWANDTDRQRRCRWQECLAVAPWLGWHSASRQHRPGCRNDADGAGAGRRRTRRV